MSDPIIHDPGNDRRIDRLYVFMSIDEQGRNGIVASILPGLGSTPLITGSPKAAEYMKGLAQQVADKTGKAVGLFVFTRDAEADPARAQLWQSK